MGNVKYSPKYYLEKVNTLIEDVDSALENKRVGEYEILLNQLSKLELGLPSLVDKTTARSISGRRIKLQMRLIEELKNSAQ